MADVEQAPGVPARRRLPPGERRAQLLDVAERVFVVHGYQGTAMEDIATEAGVTRGLVYNYFADKDALYLECVRRARADLEAAFTEAARRHETPRERLVAGITAYFSFVQQRHGRWDLLFGAGTAVAGGVAEEVGRLRFATADKIGVLVRDAMPGLDEEAATAYAHLVSGAGEQLAKWWRAHPEVPLDRVVAYQLDALWGGLGSVAARTRAATPRQGS